MGDQLRRMAEAERETEDGLFNRRQVITGGVIAALGVLWLPKQGDAATITPPPGAEGASVIFDVACLGPSFSINTQSALDAKAGDMRGTSFSVEGNLYPAGTIPAGAGFDPASVAPMGHWFCRGWFLIMPSRQVPHVISSQEYLFGRISDAQPSPPDQIASSGVEGGITSSRSVIGGTGRYRGILGEVVQQPIGTNTTVLNAGFGLAPTFRFYVTL